MVGDVNSDAHPDLVVDSFTLYEHHPDDGGWLERIDYHDVLLGNGSGGFGWVWDLAYLPGGSPPPDFNRDGIADQFFTKLGDWDAWARSHVGSSVSVQLGDGAGGFGVPQTVWMGDMATEAVTAGDFNHDGYTDLAVGSSSSRNGSVHVLRNDAVWPPLPPPIAAVRIDDVSVTEGNAGVRTATFTVRLSIASSQPVTVDYATADGTATAGADYQSASGTLTFAPGETTKLITVPVNGDRLGEPDETFAINLSNPTNSYIADGQGLATIVDDEPRISISDVTKAEGRKGKTTLFIFTVTLSAAYDQPVTMSFATADGTARA